MFTSFNFELLNNPEFKEDSVREELLVPLLTKLGYSASGECGIIRSKQLVHPFVMIGTQKRKINIIPDYILTYKNNPIIVIDAKAPDKSLVKSFHAEQAFSYAIHPEIRVFRYALFNGRQLVVYDVDKYAPILIVEIQKIEERWKEVESVLSAEFVLNPEKLNYVEDLGLFMKKAGMTEEGTQHFIPMKIYDIAMYSVGNYTSFSAAEFATNQKMGASIDYTQEQLEQILSIVSKEKREVIKEALKQHPYHIYLKTPIPVVVETRLGELQKCKKDEFVPFIVTKIDVEASIKYYNIEDCEF